MSQDLEQVSKDLGFASAEEFHRLVASVPFSDPSKIALFKAWQEENGTKAGLLTIFPELEHA